jgi:hypothetical protein
VRQGDPLSPILFNLAADIVAVLVKRSQGEGLLTGLGTSLVEGGVSILQYVDDTILLLEDNLDQART